MYGQIKIPPPKNAPQSLHGEDQGVTGTQGGWERRTPMGIWWETEHIMLTRSSSGVGIAMWRGSTQMVGEPV